MTVNLSVAAPNYCGYLNVNDIPDMTLESLSMMKAAKEVV